MERLKTCGYCGGRLSRDPNKLLCSTCGTPVTYAAGPVNDSTVLLSDAEVKPIPRMVTGPWDPCFGGGVAEASVTLIGGAAGAGKSTMALQLVDNVAGTLKRETLYLAAEENAAQVRDRAQRIGVKHPQMIRLVPSLGGFQGNLHDLVHTRKPAVIVVDSLPGLRGEGDANPEIAVLFAKWLKGFAVSLNCPVLIVDHVTKKGEFAGAMALQHAVDTTIQLFKESDASEIREMTTIKNRFGPAGVCVRLLMTATGLKATGPQDEDEEDEEDVHS